MLRLVKLVMDVAFINSIIVALTKVGDLVATMLAILVKVVVTSFLIFFQIFVFIFLPFFSLVIPSYLFPC